MDQELQNLTAQLPPWALLSWRRSSRWFSTRSSSASYFREKPFQNWTRETAAIIGTVFLYTDYKIPVEAVHKKLNEIAAQSPLWDKQVVNLQVTEAYENTIQLRALVSASTSPRAWDLRCEVREKLLGFLQAEYPDCLPRYRLERNSRDT